MTFNDDGNGSLIYKSTNSDETYNYSFKYAINGNKITFEEWSKETFTNYQFVNATVVENGNTISCYSENASLDYVFTATN